MDLLIYVLPFLGLIIGGVVGFWLKQKVDTDDHQSIKQQGIELIQEAIAEANKIKKNAIYAAERKSKNILTEAKIQNDDARSELKIERTQLKTDRDELRKEREKLSRFQENLTARDKKITTNEQLVIKKDQQIDRLIEEQQYKLEKIAGISKEDALVKLETSLESEARMLAAKKLAQIENEMKVEADRKSKKILALAISRYAGDYVADRTVSVVPLPNDEMKGRIIGREGRNIRAIEAATGIDIIIDDTPEAVILSGFNPVRREVARLSLLQLIGDGRIHPARIEDVVEKVTQELDIVIKEAGEQATFDVGCHGVHIEIMKLLGMLKYRTSYGQNVLQHSLEVAFLCGIMAAELGIDVKKAKRAGLLHDIGKAVDHEVEGSHASIGRDLAKKYGEADDIVYAIGAHHEEQPLLSVLDILVQSADALSGARPGARKEMLQTYVQRLEELEEIANGFDGVVKSYAIQAGRDLRIIVDSQKVRDAEAVILSQDIAQAVEEQLTYPGQIRVTVIRETRAVGYAK